MNHINLLKYNGDDFEVWKSEGHGFDYYHISIEGYIGFEKLDSFIPLYEGFLEKLQEYLIANNHEKTNKHNWKCLYQTRAMEITYEHDCYWIFLDTYKATEIWDLYYYTEDVIKQLKDVIELNIEPSESLMA